MSLRACFLLSMIANVLLLGAWLLRHDDRVATSDSTPAPAVDPESATAPKSTRPFSSPTVATKPLDWRESLTTFREAGVPSAILARLVVEKVAEKWTPLEQRFEQQYLNDEIDAKRLAELHDERAREQVQELRVALGDGYEAWEKQHLVDNMYLGGLRPTEPQRDLLYPLQKNYLQRLHELEIARRNGQLDETAFASTSAQIDTEYKTRLAGIIGPERVDFMSGREDPVVQVRRDFARLQLSPAQMRDLAAVQQKWNETRAMMAKSLEETREMDVAYEGDLRAIDRARDTEFRRVLGGEAFDAWQKSRDDRYSALEQNAQRWNLDQELINGVYQTIRTYDLAVVNHEHEAQARAHAGEPVDWLAVEMTVAEYTRQTESALRRYLGDDRFEQMRQTEIFGFRPTPTMR
jgi:hypothetical protein